MHNFTISMRMLLLMPLILPLPVATYSCNNKAIALLPLIEGNKGYSLITSFRILRRHHGNRFEIHMILIDIKTNEYYITVNSINLYSQFDLTGYSLISV
jgi:hypothetical protein